MLHVFRTQIDQNDIFWTTKFQIKKLFFSSFIIFKIHIINSFSYLRPLDVFQIKVKKKGANGVNFSMQIYSANLFLDTYVRVHIFYFNLGRQQLFFQLLPWFD